MAKKKNRCIISNHTTLLYKPFLQTVVLSPTQQYLKWSKPLTETNYNNKCSNEKT